MSCVLRSSTLFLLLLALIGSNAYAQADGYFDSTWTNGGTFAFPGDFANPTVPSSVTGMVQSGAGDILLYGYTFSGESDDWWLGDLRLNGQFAPTFGSSDGSGRIASCTLSSDSSCMGGGPVSLIIQPDGDYVVFTSAQIWRTLPQAHALDVAGVVGGTGFVNNVFSINNVEGYVVAMYGLPPLPDGKILVAGASAYSGASCCSFGLVRLHTDLSLDATFNAITDGNGVTFAGGSIVTVNAADDFESPSAVLAQSDGKFIVVGSGLTESTNVYREEVVRYMPDGSLDTTFGNGGTFSVTPPHSPTQVVAALDRADRIVLLTSSETTPGSGVFGVLASRVNSDGTLDTTFGTNGFTFFQDTSRCSQISASSVGLDSAGRIVIAGGCTLAASNFALFVMRLRGDTGQIDPSFGVSGVGIGHFATGDTSDQANAILFDPGGRPIVAGATYGAATSNIDEAAVARLTYDLIFTSNFEVTPPGCLSPNCN